MIQIAFTDKKPAQTGNTKIIFNGAEYSEEEWNAYWATREPHQLLLDYIYSDHCPPHQKAAWERLWRLLLSKVEEGEKSSTENQEN